MTPQAIGEINASESPRGTERRLSCRVACEGFAEIFAFDAGFLFRGEIRDISQTGCYIKTKARLKLERLAEVDVLFRLKNHEYRILARIMDVRSGKGAGLEFLFHSPRTEDDSFQRLLAALVYEASQKQTQVYKSGVAVLHNSDREQCPR